MRLRDTMNALRRRWYLLALGLVVTAVGCFFVFDQTPADYEARGSMVLMPPPATVGDEGNPFLFLGGMGQALDVLNRHVNAAEVTEPVLDAHPGTTYTIDPDPSTSGSIIQIVATGPSPKAAMAVLYDALGTVPVALDAMQNDLQIEDYLRISVMPVVVDDEATKDDKDRLQALIFAAATGIVATILLVGIVDGVLLSAGRRPGTGHNADALHSRHSSAAEDVTHGRHALGLDGTEGWGGEKSPRAPARRPDFLPNSLVDEDSDSQYRIPASRS